MLQKEVVESTGRKFVTTLCCFTTSDVGEGSSDQEAREPPIQVAYAIPPIPQKE